MSSPAFQQVANAVITGQMTLDEALPLMLSLATQNGASS
jgi:DNA-binding transcriptional regulator YhcF (GntR family)